MRSPLVLLACAVVLGVVMLFAESPVALSFVLTDGLPAALILLLAAIPGALILWAIGIRTESPAGDPRLRFGLSGWGGGVCDEPLACRIIFGLGIGVGLLCLLEFTLGVCGWLGRSIWLAIFGGLVAASALAYGGALRRAYVAGTKVELPAVGPWHWVWLVVVPFAALTLLVATAPPGVLWPAEGNGYDVLEYHLAVPKAYVEAGRIGFLPNNVYSNFPMNAEMLYLLAMALRGGAIEGIMLAQMFNALLAFLTVGAVWAAARPFGSRVALFAAVLAGTCGWLVYLSGVAYVENAMLLFTALAIGAWLRAGYGSERWALLAGAFAGMACGCKYTAAVLVAIPLGLAILARAIIRLMSCRRRAAHDSSLITHDSSLSSQPSVLSTQYSVPSTAWGVRGLLLFLLGTLATFGPWLVKNAVYCGNPVFPLATKWLGYRPGAWDSASEARWREGHRPPAAARSAPGRVAAAWAGVVRDPRTGTLLWILAALALLRNWRVSWPLAAVVGVQVLLWAGTTTLVERFAVPVLPPLFLLAASIVCRCDRNREQPTGHESPAQDLDGKPGTLACPQRAQPSGTSGSTGSGGVADHGAKWTAAACAAVLIVASLSLYQVGRLYYHRSRFLNADGSVEKIPWHGQTEWLFGGQWPGTAQWGFIDRELRPDARVLLVADARSLYVRRKCGYTVVFNANPLATVAGPAGDAVGVLAWLRSSGWTHVYVDWGEMERLRRTYGFWPGVDEVLFTELAQLGLRELRHFALTEGGVPYGTIYEVPK